MAAPHQNIADIVVLKASAEDPAVDDLNLDGGAPVGASLAALRKAKGLTHDDVFAGTKIKPAHIAAIEAGDLDALPATPFTAGFVKAYAQFLGLDADRFARAYKEETGFVPLAAPALTAIMREAAKSRAEARPDEPARPAAPQSPADAAAPAPAMAPALSPAAPARSLAAPTAVVSAPVKSARGFEADKLVSWLGAGAAIAIAAFLAGRAVQPNETTSEIAAPPPTVIPEAPVLIPAPEAVAAAATEAVEAAPPAVEPIETVEPVEPVEPARPTPVAAVKAPTVKPQPKQRPAEEVLPAPIEATPVPVLYTTPAVEPEPPAAAEAPAPDALAAAEPPAAVAEEPAAPPAPVIVPARMIRGATPEYPERCAGRAGEKVAVSVIFSITTEGRPVSASVVSSGDRCFNTAAQRAVYDMRFTPRTVDGVPAVETGKTVTIQFVR